MGTVDAKGPDIFLLRGLVRESRHWGDFIPALERALPRARVAALDLPGTGRRNGEVCPVSIPKMLESVREEFLSLKNGGGSAVLVAISLGGMIGFEWLKRFPGDFERAVFLNTSLKGLSPVHHRMIPRNLPTLARIFLSGDAALRERLILGMCSNKTEDYEKNWKFWVEIQKDRPVSPANALRQLVAAALYGGEAERPDIPVLILASPKDRLVSSECSARIAAAWGLPILYHPTAGHALPMDDPEWTAERVREFVSR